eukprot:2521696-Heterocapsa_arctica.AAC.1
MWVRHLDQHREHIIAAGKYRRRVRLKLGVDGKHWNRVKGKGTMAAAIATLFDIGRDPISPCMWADPNGDGWEIGSNYSSGLVFNINKTVNSMAWARAAQHFQGSGLETVALLCAVNEVVSCAEKYNIQGLAGMARCVAAGGFWWNPRFNGPQQ